MKRESRSRRRGEEQLKVADPFVVRPRAFQNGSGPAKRVRSQTAFNVGLPRARKSVTVLVRQLAVAVFFVVRPVAFRNQ